MIRRSFSIYHSAGKEEPSMDKEYKISNSGTQVVKAPKQTAEKGKKVVKTGTDLRSK